MTKKQVAKLEHGIYKIYWRGEGGDYSLAAVGSDSAGRRWFAPTNWLAVPSFDWRKVEDAVPLLKKPPTNFVPWRGAMKREIK